MTQGSTDSGETTETTENTDGAESSDDSAAAETTEEPTEEAAAEDLSGAIATGGSTSVEDVIGSLSEAFMEEYPDVDITYDPNGSGAGITGASDGTYDLGLSSRDLTDEETGQGLVATTFALDGIAIVVHPDNTVTDLTLDNIKALATGEITNWSEVGGPDAPVVSGRP